MRLVLAQRIQQELIGQGTRSLFIIKFTNIILRACVTSYKCHRKTPQHFLSGNMRIHERIIITTTIQSIHLIKKKILTSLNVSSKIAKFNPNFKNCCRKWNIDRETRNVRLADWGNYSKRRNSKKNCRSLLHISQLKYREHERQAEIASRMTPAHYLSGRAFNRRMYRLLLSEIFSSSLFSVSLPAET